MKKICLALSLLAFSNPCQAALSPFFQGVREIKDILDHPYLTSHLSQKEPLLGLELFEESEGYRIYRLESENSYVFAKLNYIKTAKLGPRFYDIEWSQQTK